MDMPDIDERVQPAADNREADKSSRIDSWLVGGIMVVAAAAAAFPWYVFFNPDKFGVSVAGWESLRDLPQGKGGGVAVGDPSSEQPKVESTANAHPSVDADPLVTATVSQLGRDGKAGKPEGVLQPFPGGGNLRLLHVANGRALIEDSSGIFLVQVGSILPDNSRLAALRERDGKWEIVTSTGKVYGE